jgi:DNA-binding MarR family transcriptional regulator
MSTKLGAPRRTRRSESVAVGRALQGLLAAVVRNQPRDMSLTSLSTLSTLEQTGPRRITDLAASEGVAQPSMTALVSTLEHSGLVERRADPNDRRVVLVALSSDGLDYIRTRQRTLVEEFAQLIDQLPAEQTGALVAAIPALVRLRNLDEERRNPSKDSPPSAGKTHPRI